MKYFILISTIFFISCAGKTAHDTISPVGKPIGTVLAAVQAPIQGASASYAEQSTKTQTNPYGR